MSAFKFHNIVKNPEHKYPIKFLTLNYTLRKYFLTNSRFSVFFLGTKLWNEILNEEKERFEYNTIFGKMHQTKIFRSGAQLLILIKKWEKNVAPFFILRYFFKILKFITRLCNSLFLIWIKFGAWWSSDELFASPIPGTKWHDTQTTVLVKKSQSNIITLFLYYYISSYVLFAELLLLLLFFFFFLIFNVYIVLLFWR